jgi:hypothetical protein
VRKQDTDEETESEEELDDDFDIVSKRLMMKSTHYSSIKQDESEAHKQ